MVSQDLNIYMPIVILLGLAILIVVGAITVGHFLRPSKPTALKEMPYECGEEPVGPAWANFNIRFYVIALIFIIFDVESALMFPVAAVYSEFVEAGQGGVILSSLLLFITVLVFGIIYCWKKGDLDWVRSFQLPQEKNKLDNK